MIEVKKDLLWQAIFLEARYLDDLQAYNNW